ncbi:protein SSUH2 homolog isoform X2 [Anabrus simplex]|uniref:protein SSUH2 homolog isoform X2 n=1 Tax=Anabrus simplex TaxID=316456 RepID=UPI0034DDC90B
MFQTVEYIHQTENDVVPSAPPLELMDQVTGYETISFDAVNIPPPSSTRKVSTSIDFSARSIRPTQPHVTEKQARDALLAYAKKHCCYGEGVAKNMAVTQLSYSSAFHYELQTFTEKRETSWTYTPYTGLDYDGVDNGVAPLPWDIEATPTKIFQDEIKIMQVPHTASVKACHRCHRIGTVSCSDCKEKGWVRCIHCNGSSYGKDGDGNKERCYYCYSTTHGRGRQDCDKCSATGKVNCPACDGSGQILCFIQLTITWKLNTSEHITERVSLPEKLVRVASGEVAFEEEGPTVSPVVKFPDETINLASAQLLQQHKRAYKDLKLLAQRQQVRIIPVSTIRYDWKSHSGEFFIYGYENKVYAPDYPDKCCCACTLI